MVPGIAREPQLSPDAMFEGGRDPFQAKDPWAESAPALLAVPPARTWARAFPGGVVDEARGPNDRPLIDREPKGSSK